MGMYKKKGFWGGEHGHVHGLQEFGIWALLVGLLTWVISPLAGALGVIFLLKKADTYWIEREVQQSIAMGRKYTDLLELRDVPPAPTAFWTADAIADVLFPRKCRKLWLALSVIYIFWMANKVGFLGFLLRGFFNA